jgi:hypothetical protein
MLSGKAGHMHGFHKDTVGKPIKVGELTQLFVVLPLLVGGKHWPKAFFNAVSREKVVCQQYLTK